MQGDFWGLFSGKKCRLLVCLTLKLGRISCAETSVNNYKITQKSEETSKQCCYLEVRCFFLFVKVYIAIPSQFTLHYRVSSSVLCKCLLTALNNVSFASLISI